MLRNKQGKTAMELLNGAMESNTTGGGASEKSGASFMRDHKSVSALLAKACGGGNGHVGVRAPNLLPMAFR